MGDIDNTPIQVTEELGGAGRVLASSAGQIEDELNSLMAQLMPLQESWRNSQASAYYEEMQHAWNTSSMALFGPGGVLEQIGLTLDTNYLNYASAEEHNIRTWQHVG